MKLLKNLGIDGIDAVSPNEVLVALNAGFDKKDITYTANYIRNDEIKFAVEQGIILNVAEIESLERLIEFKAEVIIRMNLEIGIGHHSHVNTGGCDSKFGIHMMWKDRI